MQRSLEKESYICKNLMAENNKLQNWQKEVWSLFYNLIPRNRQESFKNPAVLKRTTRSRYERVTDANAGAGNCGNRWSCGRCRARRVNH